MDDLGSIDQVEDKVISLLNTQLEDSTRQAKLLEKKQKLKKKRLERWKAAKNMQSS
jgi:hypothetical protein